MQTSIRRCPCNSNNLARVLHSLSFVDDPTRMLRAVRFEQRFGFQIERRTLELLNHALPLLERISGDRIRSAWDIGDVEAAPMMVGQSIGLIHPLPTCKSLLETMMAEAEERLRSAMARIQD